MATKSKPKEKAGLPTYGTHISNCNFQGVGEKQAEALLAFAQVLTEQAKAVQAIASALKGPECLLRIEGAR